MLSCQSRNNDDYIGKVIFSFICILDENLIADAAGSMSQENRCKASLAPLSSHDTQCSTTYTHTRTLVLSFSLLLNFRHSRLWHALTYHTVCCRTDITVAVIIRLLSPSVYMWLTQTDLSVCLYLLAQCAFLVKFLLSVNSVHHYRLPPHSRRDVSLASIGRSQVISDKLDDQGTRLDRLVSTSEDIVIYLEHILSD